MQAPASNITESHLRAAIAQLIEEDDQLEEFERRHESRYPFFQPVTIAFENGDHSLSGILKCNLTFNAREFRPIGRIYGSAGGSPAPRASFCQAIERDKISKRRQGTAWNRSIVDKVPYLTVWTL